MKNSNFNSKNPLFFKNTGFSHSKNHSTILVFCRCFLNAFFSLLYRQHVLIAKHINMKSVKYTSFIFTYGFQALIGLLSLVSWCALPNNQMNAQGLDWERHYDNDSLETGYAAIQANNFDIIAVGSTQGSFNPLTYLLRTDVDGFEKWSAVLNYGSGNEIFSLLTSADGHYIGAGYITGAGNGKKDVWLVKFDDNGQIIWQKTYGTALDDRAYQVKAASDGGYILTGSREINDTNTDILLLKTDADGNEQWVKTFGGPGEDEGKSVAVTADGGYVMTGSYEVFTNNKNIFVIRTEADGDEVWTNNLIGSADPDAGNAIITTTGGWYAVVGQFGYSNDIYFFTMNDEGTQLLESTYGETGVEDIGLALSQTVDGGYIITGYSDEGASGYAILLRTNANGEEMWFRTYGKPGTPLTIAINRGSSVFNTLDGGFIVCGSASENILSNNDDLFLFKTDSLGNTYTNYITGTVFRDLDDNCQFDNGESPFHNWLVEVTGPYTFYGSTNEAGYYSIPVDTGLYEVRVYPDNDYWQSCQSSYNVNIQPGYDTLVRSFAIYPIITCPYMRVNISAAFLRRCMDNAYTVNWCNTGTATADNATVEVSLDADMVLAGSTIPWTMQQGNTYTFPLGDVVPGECGSFQLTIFLDCDATVVGQTHCVTAHILPDSLCFMASPDWDGASLHLEGRCENDTVFFSLRNQGATLTHDDLEYIVIEDDVLFLRDTIPALGPLGTLDLSFSSAIGSTYRMIAEQSPGHPGNSFPTIAIEGCGAGQGTNFSLGYVTMFAEDDADPFIDTDCKESIETYISFEKGGHPKGYGPDHQITDSTDLEYLIHFQNTTTGVVNRVIVMDTLSEYVDIATIEPGASSHPYSYEVYGDRFIRFTFDNIDLPDSTGNEPGSHGFVQFRLSQKPGNPAGTLILNRAAVFLDYYAPVLTNETVHVVDSDFIAEVILETADPVLPSLPVLVYPNPFTEYAIFDLGDEQGQNYTFELFDLEGKQLYQQTFTHSQFRLERSLLATGVYLFRIGTDRPGTAAVTGKIIVH